MRVKNGFGNISRKWWKKSLRLTSWEPSLGVTAIYLWKTGWEAGFVPDTTIKWLILTQWGMHVGVRKTRLPMTLRRLGKPPSSWIKELRAKLKNVIASLIDATRENKIILRKLWRKASYWLWKVSLTALIWALTEGIRPWTFQSAMQNRQYVTSQTTHRTPSRATSPCLSGRHLNWRQRSLPSKWSVSTYSQPCGQSVAWDFSTPLLGREYYTLRKLWRIHSDDSPKAHWTKSTTSVVLHLQRRLADDHWEYINYANSLKWPANPARHASYCIDLFSKFIDSQRTDE